MLCEQQELNKGRRKSTPTKSISIKDSSPGYILKFEFGADSGNIVKNVNYQDLPSHFRNTIKEEAKSGGGGRELRKKNKRSASYIE